MSFRITSGKSFTEVSGTLGCRIPGSDGMIEVPTKYNRKTSYVTTVSA
jgi:hypothetical protein